MALKISRFSNSCTNDKKRKSGMQWVLSQLVTSLAMVSRPRKQTFTIVSEIVWHIQRNTKFLFFFSFLPGAIFLNFVFSLYLCSPCSYICVLRAAIKSIGIEGIFVSIFHPLLYCLFVLYSTSLKASATFRISCLLTFRISCLQSIRQH